MAEVDNANKTEEKKEENKKEGEDNAAIKVDMNGEDEEKKSGDGEEKENDGDDSSQKATTRIATADWPLRGIKEPHENDVLYGRGGGTNHHPGNKRYRKMVEDRKLDYVNSKRLDKPMVALEIIRQWRAQDPPGAISHTLHNTTWSIFLINHISIQEDDATTSLSTAGILNDPP